MKEKSNSLGISQSGRVNERSGCGIKYGEMGTLSSWREHGLSEGSSCCSVPVLVPRVDAGLMLPDLQFFERSQKNLEFWKSICIQKLDLII